MNDAQFWAIVDKGKRSEEPEELLRRNLARLSPADVVAFDRLFVSRVDDAYHWDLWGAAYLLEGGCSDDGFTDFRYGLIAKGRAIYERALRAPDSLVNVEVTSNEEMGCVAGEVYEERTGKQLPSPRSRRAKPRGRRWNFDDDAQRARRLPRLHLRVARDEFDALAETAWTKEQAGDLAGANADYRAALVRLPTGGRPDILANVHANVMSNDTTLGSIASAWHHFEEARRRRRSVRDRERRAILDNQLAWFIYEHGSDDQLPDALRWAREARQLVADLAAMDTEVRILLRLGRDSEARAVAARALRIDPRFPALQDLKKRWGLGRGASKRRLGKPGGTRKQSAG